MDWNNNSNFASTVPRKIRVEDTKQEGSWRPAAQLPKANAHFNRGWDVDGPHSNYETNKIFFMQTSRWGKKGRKLMSNRRPLNTMKQLAPCSNILTMIYPLTMLNWKLKARKKIDAKSSPACHKEAACSLWQLCHYSSERKRVELTFSNNQLSFNFFTFSFCVCHCLWSWIDRQERDMVSDVAQRWKFGDGKVEDGKHSNEVKLNNEW